MLADEERQYAAELEASQETTVERQAKMRDRAHMLREKREAERKALAQEKYDQRWRWVTYFMTANLSRTLI